MHLRAPLLGRPASHPLPRRSLRPLATRPPRPLCRGGTQQDGLPRHPHDPRGRRDARVLRAPRRRRLEAVRGGYERTRWADGRARRRDHVVGGSPGLLLRGGHAVNLPSSLKLKLPERIGWRDHVIGALLAVVYVVWLLATARSLGFPRDEGMYFHAGSEYMRWIRLLLDRGAPALEPGTIDGAWSTNHEHPGLMKALFGASHYLFYEKWRLFHDGSTAYRLPGMATAGLAIWVTYLF